MKDGRKIDAKNVELVVETEHMWLEECRKG